MGTPNSHLNMSAFELMMSEVPEERDLGKEVSGRMDQLVAHLKSILRYLINQDATRLVTETDGVLQLYVGGNGSWVVFDRDKGEFVVLNNKYVDTPWLLFPAQKVTQGLLTLIKEVEEAREKRLTSIREARVKLQQIEQILNS